jgi:branched-chain amino acid transport system permease protein
VAPGLSTRPARRAAAGRPGSWRRRAGLVGALVVVGVFAVLGLGLGEYDTGLLTTAFLYGIAAVSLDLVWGYVGTPDLGHALWFGLGALTVGMTTTELDTNGILLTVHGGPLRYGLGVLLGVLVAMLVAVVVARFSFSARGSAFYIAVVTLALSTVATTLYTQFPRRTGGDNGLFGFAPLNVPARTWYYVALVALVAVTAGALVLVRSDAGLVLRAVRDNETRARYLGYDVERVKTVMFAAGAGLSAFAGGLYALVFGLVSADLFSFLFATQMLVWVAVGGRGTIIGPVVGAVGLQLAGAHLSASFPTQWALIEGALFVLVVMFMPDGVLPPLARLLARLTGPDRWAAPPRELSLDPAAPPRRPTSSPVIDCSGLEFDYGSLRVLRGIDLSVNRGELLCMVGPNGAGKSTLLAVLADGTLRARGTVRYELGRSAPHRRRPPHRIARYGVARKFQAPQLFASLTVAEAILLARRNGRLPSLWRRTRHVAVGPPVLDIIAATGLEGRDNDLTTTLAHGLKQGVEIAGAVAGRPQVLLLDEPTAGLTGPEREVVGAVLRRLVGNGMTVVLIEHDLDFVNQIADRVVVLHEGRIIENGTPEAVSNSAVVREAYLGSGVS